MIINHNALAQYSANRVNQNVVAVQRDSEKLASGLRINRAADDASGLGLSEKLRSTVRGLSAAQRNMQDSSSLITTADGYLQETTDILQRIRELSITAGNSVFSEEDRLNIEIEVSSLVMEIDRIASTAQFGGLKLLSGRFASPQQDGSGGDALVMHCGSNMDERIELYIDRADAASLGLREGDSRVSVADVESANRAIGTIDEALKKVNFQRASLGAAQNRLEHAMRGTTIAIENTQSAESLIRDTDFAVQMAEYVKNSILQQSATAILAQANSHSQDVLSLLR